MRATSAVCCIANDGRAIDGMLSDGMLIWGKLIDGMLGILIDGIETLGIDGSEGSLIPENSFFCTRGGAGTISLFVPPKNDFATGRTGADAVLVAGGCGAAGFRAGDDSSLMRRSTSGPSRLSADMMPI